MAGTRAERLTASTTDPDTHMGHQGMALHQNPQLCVHTGLAPGVQAPVSFVTEQLSPNFLMSASLHKEATASFVNEGSIYRYLPNETFKRRNNLKYLLIHYKRTVTDPLHVK